MVMKRHHVAVLILRIQSGLSRTAAQERAPAEGPARLAARAAPAPAVNRVLADHAPALDALHVVAPGNGSTATREDPEGRHFAPAQIRNPVNRNSPMPTSTRIDPRAAAPCTHCG